MVSAIYSVLAGQYGGVVGGAGSPVVVCRRQ
jgi:hypothetical protein